MSTAFRLFHNVRSAALCAGLLALLASPAAQADRIRRPAPPPWETAFRGRLVTVEVQVDGRTAPLYSTSHDDERRYVEARRGENYALRIRNQTGRRVGVLVSVDGLNVVNGARSALASHEPMYVLDAWETATIRGWRASLEHVRKFVFVDEERSYATRTGQENGDLGWIRVLAFEEVPPVALFDPSPRNHDRGDRQRDELNHGTAGAPSADAPVQGKGKSKSQDMAQSAPPTLESHGNVDSKAFPGTGWGDRQRDPVRETWFDPQPCAVDHLVMRYEYAHGLAELGIYRDRDRLAERDRGEFGFARPPLR